MTDNPEVAATAAETVLPGMITESAAWPGDEAMQKLKDLDIGSMPGVLSVGPVAMVTPAAPTFYPVTPGTPEAARAFKRMLDGETLKDGQELDELKRGRLQRMVEEAE